LTKSTTQHSKPHAGAKGDGRRRTARGEAPWREVIDEIEEFDGQLASLMDSKAVMNALASRMVEHFGMATSAVWKVNESQTELELGAAFGKPSLPAKLGEMHDKASLLGRALRERRPQVLRGQDIGHDELSEWARKNHLRYLAVYPLAHNAHVDGLLLIAGEHPPAEQQQELFRVESRLVSTALREVEMLASTRHTLNKLSILVEASKALSSTLDLSELLGRILDVAKTQAECERGTLFLVDEKAGEIWSLIAHGLEKQEIRLPLGKGIVGHVASTGEIVNIPDAYADPRFNPEVDKRTGYRTRNILCLPIRNKANKIVAALQLLNKKRGAFTDEDADFLLTLSGHMALAIENAQLHQVLLDKERMEKELALARGIQRSLLPETAPTVEGFDIALVNEPCFAVGGDYYDFLSLGPQTLLVVIADVEGKGVSSALVMSNLQATLRALVLHLHSLNEIAEALNRMIWNDTRAQKYMSLFMGLIDLRRKGIHYINCGHVPPVIVRPQHEPIPLTEGGMVIGLFENAAYDRGQAKFQPGDVLVLCTDGITESMDAQHEEFGSERLIESVRAVADRKASEIVESVGTEVAQFSRAGTHIDDKVLIAIKVK
jgi:serine phosphatase RsbU (regulator of sigma subunit)